MERLQELGADSPETERDVLRQQVTAYKTRWLIAIGGILWVVGIYLLWRIPIWASFAGITSHANYVAITAMASVALGGLVWALLDDKPSRRNFAFGSVAVAAILAAITII